MIIELRKSKKNQTEARELSPRHHHERNMKRLSRRNCDSHSNGIAYIWKDKKKSTTNLHTIKKICQEVSAKVYRNWMNRIELRGEK